MYALVTAGTVRSVSGRLPEAARDLATGDWVCPDGGAWTLPQAEACGWFLVVSTPSPAVTAAEVAEASVTLVAGVPQVTWTIRAKTAEQIAAETASTNEQALLDKARAALTANATFLAIASPTNAQTLAQVQRMTRELNALIKLEVGDLADQSGT